MSRNYEVQVEIFPCPYNDEDHVSDVLVKWGLDFDSDTETFDDEGQDGWAYWGNIQLTCGQNEKNKHDQLRDLLPSLSLTTRWRHVDDQKWDDVIITEPLKPAA